MSDTIISKAPTRVDLIGGTLDIWPISAALPLAATINMAVPLFARTRLTLRSESNISIRSLDQGKQVAGSWEKICSSKTQLPLASLILEEFWNGDLPGFEAELSADCPGGAGLGGSSCLAVSLASALSRARLMVAGTPVPQEGILVRALSALESRLIHSPTGTQDHWGAVRGGVNLITYPPAGPAVKTLRKDPFRDSPWSMILCYSGKSRCSGINNWELFRKFFNNDLTIVEKFQQIARISHKALAPAKNDDIGTLLELSQQEWQIRKSFASGIETDETRAIDRISQNAGARFSRICGAGGGGMMTVFTPKEKEVAVRAALKKAGVTIYPPGICTTGLRVSATHGQISSCTGAAPEYMA